MASEAPREEEEERKAAEPSHALWIHRQERCLSALRRGEDVEVALTAYGGNDFFFEFLMGSGLWSAMTAMRPNDLKKENGISWKALNGVEVIRELARVDRIAHVGKILADARLMLLAGFNVEEVQAIRDTGRPIVDPETLANHLNRIGRPSAQRGFREHLKILRRHRWIRGKTYAADAHEIIVPYGRKSERLGKVHDKYGFKLVVLLNIEEDQERVVGFELAPLDRSEKGMLCRILKRLALSFGPLSSWMKTLVLDRGYWGAEYLLSLKEDYGVDVVTRARDEDLAVVKDIEGLLELMDRREWTETRETRSRLGEIRVRSMGLSDLPLRDRDGREVGTANAVVADEFDLSGRPLKDPASGEERGRWYYITTLPVQRNPYRIRDLYRSRWTIENQGFREMTQRWALDTPAGRRFRLIHARLTFALMLYNAERVLRWKFPGPWYEERQRLKGLGLRTPIEKIGIVSYTSDGALGLLSKAEFEQAIRENERGRIIERLQEALQKGESLTDLLRRMTPPS